MPHDPVSAGGCEGLGGRFCVPVMLGGQWVAFGTMPMSLGDAIRMLQAIYALYRVLLLEVNKYEYL